MSLEASIIERLQELRKWQVDQQERLLKQQQKQRQKLNIEQEQLCKALGLSLDDLTVAGDLIDQVSLSESENVNGYDDDHDNSTAVNSDAGENLQNFKSMSFVEGNSVITASESDYSLKIDAFVTKSDMKNQNNNNYYDDNNDNDDNDDNDDEGMHPIEETPRKQFSFNSFNSENNLTPYKTSFANGIDEIPVPSPKKDFNTLLEEKLKNSEESSGDNSDKNEKNIIKRPFLKKGAGLARFRMAPKNINNSNKKNNNNNNNKNIIKNDKLPKNSVAQKSKINCKIQKCNSTSNNPSSTKLTTRKIGDIKKVEKISRRSHPISKVPQQKLNLKNVPLSSYKYQRKSLPAKVNKPLDSFKTSNSPANTTEKNLINESNSSDLDTSKLETKMFELLEEKAENSSFCSTSSAVLTFMQQSTPVMLRNINKNSELSKKLSAVDNAINDDDLNEIVKSLKSNKLQIDMYSSGEERSSCEKNVNGSLFTTKTLKNDGIDVDNYTRDVLNHDSGNFLCKNGRIKEDNGDDCNFNHQVNSANLRKQLAKFKYDEEIEKDDKVDEMLPLEEIKSIDGNDYSNLIDVEANRYKINDADVSVHVRFSEFNEYKTLTDSSIMSRDSYTSQEDDNIWSDNSESGETHSDIEITSSQLMMEMRSGYGNKRDLAANQTNKTIENKKIINYNNNSNDNSSDHVQSDNLSTDDDDEDEDDDDQSMSEYDTTIAEFDKNTNENNCLTHDKEISAVDEQTILKSELLKKRLLELEREIDIFRKENTDLASQRQQLREEQNRLRAEFKEKNATLDRERSEMEQVFQEERKRLLREKVALENRLKDAREKSLQSMQERLEIKSLQAKLGELKNEINEKENRWRAAHARQLSQIRVLQQENTQLKQEINKYIEINSKKKYDVKLMKKNGVSSTKIIHEINKRLDDKRGNLSAIVANSKESNERKKVANKSKNKISSMINGDRTVAKMNSLNNSPINNDDDGDDSDDSDDVDDINNDNSDNETEGVLNKSRENPVKKRNMYENLLKEANDGVKKYLYHQESENEKNGEFERTMDNQENISPDNQNINKNRNSDHENHKNIAKEVKKNRVNDVSGGQIMNYDDIIENQKQYTGKINCSTANEQVSTDYQLIHKDPRVVQKSYKQFVQEVNSIKNKDKKPSNSNEILRINSPKNTFEAVDCYRKKYSGESMIPKFSNENGDDQAQNPSSNYANLIAGNDGNVGDAENLNSPVDSDLMPRRQYQKPLPISSEMIPHATESNQVSQIIKSPTRNSTDQTAMKGSISEVQHPDGHIEYWYPNGNVKRVYPDRNTSKMIYYNGDVKETTADGRIKYFYAATKTWQTTYPDGFEILEFPDGQQERRTADGVTEVSFPDGSIRLMQPDGVEKWVLTDGTIAEVYPNGDKVLSLPNGQREIHTSDHKRREYPDGTMKFVYNDGTQETRYSNGRIRMKDKDGKLIMDSHQDQTM